jgi:hypothetical protein
MDRRDDPIDPEFRVRDESSQGRPHADDEEGVPRSRGSRRSSRNVFAREVVWAALTIAFAVYVGSGSVSTFLGAEGRGRAGVWEVWRNLVPALPGGDLLLLRAVYVAMLVAFVGGSLVALWLALAADGSDESTERPVADGP